MSDSETSFIVENRKQQLTFNLKIMKTMTFCSAILGALLLTSSVSFASAIKSESQVIKITQVENLYLGKTAEKVWNVTYSNQEKPVTITLHQTGHSKEYIVRSEFFEVTYVLNKHGFGATRVSRSLQLVPEKINSSVINKQQLESQKILTTNQISEEYALQLIAAYLPDLLNEGYKHLLF